MARPARATILVGGHNDGIKYIARHWDQYNIQKITVIPKIPALNTLHFEAVGERLESYLLDFKYNAPAMDVWSCAAHATCHSPFNFSFGIRLYTEANTPYQLTKTMATQQLHWEALLNFLLQKTTHKNKIDHDNMPRVIECGIGGNFGLHIRDVLGYNAVRRDQYKWYGAGESPEYQYQHQQILTPFKEREIDIDLTITARP